MRIFVGMLFVWLLPGVASAEPPEPADRVAPERTAAPGTVGRPISGRIALVGAGDRVNGEWQKLTRTLLDMQADFEAALSGEAAKFRLATGEHTVVRVSDVVTVDLDVQEGPEGRRSVHLRVLDGSGQPVQGVARASLTPPGTGAEAVPLQMASGGEIVIEDLSVAEGGMVQIYMGDGDVVVIWLEESR